MPLRVQAKMVGDVSYSANCFDQWNSGVFQWHLNPASDVEMRLYMHYGSNDSADRASSSFLRVCWPMWSSSQPLLLLLLTFCTNGWIDLLACLLSWYLIDALQTNLSLLQANQRCGWSFSWSKWSAVLAMRASGCCNGFLWVLLAILDP